MLQALNTSFKLSTLLSNNSSMRTKLLGLPTSIALEIVATAFLGWYISVLKNSGTVLLALHAAIKCLTGKPLLCARIPAQMFPKLPLGTAITGGFFLSAHCFH